MLHTANDHEKLSAQIQNLEEEEYYKKLKERGVTAEFKKSELEKLHALAKDE